jgi:hypothetical protein
MTGWLDRLAGVAEIAPLDRLPGWTDRDSREPASFPAILIYGEGKRIPVTITNISADGCQVEGADAVPIAENVRLELAGNISADATVRWAVMGRAGLRFVREED